MSNFAFKSIPKQLEELKSGIDDQIIRKLYSNFTFLHFSSDIKIIKDNKNQLFEFLLNYFKKSKFLVYGLFDTSKFNDLGFKETGNSLSQQNSNYVICTENECIIIENIEKQLINQILEETKTSIIDVTEKSDDNLINEEISSFCSLFIQTIKNNSFVKLTIRSIVGYSIRRYFYPTSFFTDQSFFNFEQQQNQSESFDKFMYVKLNEVFESKNENEAKMKTQELKSKLIEINEIDYQPQIYEFNEKDFIILRTIEINETFVFNLAIHIKTLYIFMVKKILHFKDKSKIEHEINFCKNFNHRCLTRFYGFLNEKEKITGFVYEFMCNGNLSKYIKKQSKDNPDIFYSILTLMRILEGIEYLHSNFLVHRDLKPSNILLDHNFLPYISDFETIRKLDTNLSKEEFTFDFVSLFYSSPEQYNNEIISYSTDFFSFGLIVYFLFEKKDMIQIQDENLIYESIKNRKMQKIANVSDNIQNLYIENVKYQQEERLSLKENRNLIMNEILSIPNIEDYLINNSGMDKKSTIMNMYFIEIFHFIKNNLELIDKILNNLIILSPMFKFENRSMFLLNLGNSYFLGKDVEKNYIKAKKYYELSAQLNNSSAFNNLGILHKIGEEKDMNKYKKYLEMGSKLNNSTALFNLGHLYFSENIYSKAVEYFELASKLNNSNALFFIGYLYFDGTTYFKRDIPKSIKYFEQTQNTIPISLFILGYIYLSGFYIEEDYLKAIEYFDLYNKNKNIKSDKFVISEGNITNNFFNTEIFYNSLIKFLDSECFLLLGTRYLLGEGVRQNIVKAKYYFEISAEQKNLDACYILGILYLIGQGIEKDYTKSRKYFELSIFKYKGNVLNILGLIHLYGLDVDINYTKAIKYFELSAQYNNSNGLLNLGILYLKGQGVTKDFIKAKNYFELSSNLNNELALFNLGLMYESGIGVDIDYKKAQYYYELSAEKNNTVALLNLGNLYLTGLCGELNFQKAKEYYELAAKQNNQRALINLGYIFENGLGVVADSLKAKYYYELVINQGDSENNKDKKIDFIYLFDNFKIDNSHFDNKSLAYLNLAEIYFEGKNIKKDYKKAFEYLKLSAKFNNSCAFLQLGDIYYSRKEDITNYMKAILYYKKSAQLFNQIAMNKLGIIYLQGKNVKQNYLKAKFFFDMATELNFIESYYYLGILFSSGEFFDIDINRSIDYFKKCTKRHKESCIISECNSNTSTIIIRYNQNYYPSFNELGLIHIIHFNDKILAKKYFQEAAFAEFPFAQNNFGLLFQYYFDNIENARYMYERSSEHNFSLAEFNLGKLYENKGDVEKSIQYYIQASEHEKISLNFHGNKIDDNRLEISKIFIVCLTNLKLVHYFYSEEKEDLYNSNTKKYFIRAISSLIDQNEHPFLFQIDQNTLDFSYLKLFILNYPLFNNAIQLNEKNEFINRNKSLLSLKSKHKLIKTLNKAIINKQEGNTSFSDINDDFIDIIYEDPESLFDFVFQSRKRIESFIKTIEETIKIMESSLFSPPFAILFGRINISREKSQVKIKSENVNHFFYDGFGID